MRTHGWREVTAKDPCPICGKPDWCAKTVDGALAICRRVDTGEGKHATDRNGDDYWLYPLDGDTLRPNHEIELPVTNEPERADPDTLDKVYRELLSKLRLLPKHKENLFTRGLDESHIKEGLYRSLPTLGRAEIARQIVERFGADTCAKIPGLYVKDEGGRSWWSIAGFSGLLVPVRDAAGRIVALKVRADEAEPGFKYTFLSSKKHGGPGPGAPAHVPVFEPKASRVLRITEGELKADVATALSGILTISIPGVSSWKRALPIIRSLEPETVLLAFDADYRTNRHVARALRHAAQQLISEGFDVVIETWPQEHGKGIDDCLAAGHEPDQVHDVAAWIDTLAPADAEARRNDLADPLEAAKEIARGFEQRATASEHEIAEALEDERIIGALALIAKHENNAFEALCLRLRGSGMKQKHVDIIKSAVKERNKKERHLRVVQKGEELEVARVRVKDTLPDAPTDDAAVVPNGWRLLREGVFQVTERVDSEGEVHTQIVRVTPTPVVITRRLIDIEDGDEWTELAWFRDGAWQRHIVERSKIASSRTIVELAGVGLAVTSNTAPKVVEYLSNYESENLTFLPASKVSKHLGWQGPNGTFGFLWGRMLIREDQEDEDASARDDVTFRGADAGDEQIADGFHAKGTFEDWMKAVSVIAPFPKVLLSLYTAFVPPLLSILGAPNFIVDWGNRTSTGKTITLRVGASVWGKPAENEPDSAIATWDATRVGVERASAVLNNLPLILDDTKRAKNSRFVADVLYEVASGRGRRRGNTRSLSRITTWRTVLMSSGEKPAITFTEDGGTRARVLTIRGIPFGVESDEIRMLVERLDLQISANYGHAGPRFIKWVLTRREDWPIWSEEYRKMVDVYAQRYSGNVAGRLARYAAAIDIAAFLAHEALNFPWEYKDPLEDLWEQIAAESEDASGEVRALQYIMSWAYSNSESFAGREVRTLSGEMRVPVGGWLGKWDKQNWDHIAFFPDKLKAALQAGGFDPEAVLAGWKERGWIDANDKHRGYTKQRRWDGEPTWFIVLLRKAVEEIEGGNVLDAIG